MKRKFVIGLPVLVVLIIAAVAFLRPLTPGPRLPVKTLDPWILQSNDPNDPYGTYLGNGYLGVKIGADGTGAGGKCLMAGLYEGESMVPLPNWADFPLYDGKGRKFELDKSAPYRQTLNMQEGYVETELTLKAGWQRLKGKVTFFLSRQFGSGTSQMYSGIRYEFTPRFGGTVRTGSVLEPVRGWKLLPQKDAAKKATLLVQESSEFPIIEALIQDEATRKSANSIVVQRGKPFALAKYMAVTIPVGLGESAASRGFDELFVTHKRMSSELWKSQIIVDGDPAAQQTINAMMFYLLSSAGSPCSISPTGLSLDAWYGHIFWDADIWMFPSLLLQYPDFARGMVDYRHRTLPGALENAKKRGLSGAQFAWESAATGLEAAPHPYTEERHIVSDVAFAQWQYFTATRDYDWLKGTGWPVIKAAAEFWASRVHYNKAQDRYEILDVVPPDEDAMIVNNSVYTNIGAARTFEMAMSAAKTLKQSYPPIWQTIAEKMYIPFDARNKRFIEFYGYKGGQIKQADTELLIYPLMHPMPEDVKTSTFDFYKTKADPRGPAMTQSIHAIIAAELNRPDEAYQHFVDSYKEFLRGPFLMVNEKRSKTYDNMCFLTACGGTLQSVLYGFAGLRIGNQPPGFAELLPDLYIKPCLPPKWKKLEIRNLQWRGKAYNLTILTGNKWKLEETKPALPPMY